MKLPIYLDIESDTIWTEYNAQLRKVETIEQFKKFVEDWKELFSIEIPVTQEILDCVKAEKVDDIVAEVICPVRTLLAMLNAEKFVVPLNCAFIQGNGGYGEFQ